MDRRERIPDSEEQIRIQQDGLQSRLWTALPGIIDSFDAAKMTASVQPAIQGVLTGPDGSESHLNLPLLLDCPVVFPSGGGCTLTFPVTRGDECLVVLASRCIDSWWAYGGIQPPASRRMHDLSDGFVFVGARSQPRAFAVSTNNAQLRTDDGANYVELAQNGAITAVSTSTITLTAPNVIINGITTLNGPLYQGLGEAGGGGSFLGPLHVVNDVTAESTSLSTHTHPESCCSGNTGEPN